jgi:hypothetical protein
MFYPSTLPKAEKQAVQNTLFPRYTDSKGRVRQITGETKLAVKTLAFLQKKLAFKGGILYDTTRCENKTLILFDNHF